MAGNGTLTASQHLRASCRQQDEDLSDFEALEARAVHDTNGKAGPLGAAARPSSRRALARANDHEVRALVEACMDPVQLPVLLIGPAEAAPPNHCLRAECKKTHFGCWAPPCPL